MFTECQTAVTSPITILDSVCIAEAFGNNEYMFSGFESLNIFHDSNLRHHYTFAFDKKRFLILKFGSFIFLFSN